jgi:hypothetical protein
VRRGTLIALLSVVVLLVGGVAAAAAVLDHEAKGHVAKGV